MITAASIRRTWWIVVAMTAIGVIAALILTLNASPRYTAKASLLFSLGYSGSATDANQGANYTLTQIPTFATLATSETILGPVIDELGLDLSPTALADQIQVTIPPGTSVLEVAATRPTAGQAAALANAVVDALREYVTLSAPVDEELGALYSVSPIDSASAPGTPSSPNSALNLTAGALIGLLGGIVLTVWKEAADTRIRSVADLRSMTPLPVIGAVRHSHGTVPTRDAMARLAVRLRHSLHAATTPLETPEGSSTVLLSSATRGGGTSTLARELADALVASGATAAVVSTSDVAEDDTGVTSAIDRVRAARAEHAIVLVDAPAMSDDATAMTLSSGVGADSVIDATVLIVNARHARRRHVLSALDDLAAAGVPVLGIVLNRAYADELTYGRAARERPRRTTARQPDETRAAPGILRYLVKTNGGEAGA